jgi:hypothetical protein
MVVEAQRRLLDLGTQRKLTSCLVPNAQFHYLHPSAIMGSGQAGARTVKAEVWPTIRLQRLILPEPKKWFGQREEEGRVKIASFEGRERK